MLWSISWNNSQQWYKIMKILKWLLPPTVDILLSISAMGRRVSDLGSIQVWRSGRDHRGAEIRVASRPVGGKHVSVPPGPLFVQPSGCSSGMLECEMWSSSICNSEMMSDGRFATLSMNVFFHFGPCSSSPSLHFLTFLFFLSFPQLDHSQCRGIGAT